MKTWCKIVILLTEDYNNLPTTATNYELSETNENGSNKNVKLNNEAEVKRYLEESKRTIVWYKETDKKLHEVFVKFYNVTQHQHLTIRLELAKLCSSLIEKCMK